MRLLVLAVLGMALFGIAAAAQTVRNQRAGPAVSARPKVRTFQPTPIRSRYRAPLSGLRSSQLRAQPSTNFQFRPRTAAPGRSFGFQPRMSRRIQPRVATFRPRPITPRR